MVIVITLITTNVITLIALIITHYRKKSIEPYVIPITRIGVASRISNLRLEKGYSLEDFATLLEVDHKMQYDIELGLTMPNLKYIKKLVQKANIEISQLFPSSNID